MSTEASFPLVSVPAEGETALTRSTDTAEGSLVAVLLAREAEAAVA